MHAGRGRRLRGIWAGWVWKAPEYFIDLFVVFNCLVEWNLLQTKTIQEFDNILVIVMLLPFLHVGECQLEHHLAQKCIPLTNLSAFVQLLSASVSITALAQWVEHCMILRSTLSSDFRRMIIVPATLPRLPRLHYSASRAPGPMR